MFVRLARFPKKRIPKRAFSTESYTQKQEKTGRPLSPHVTIYAWPVIAISSVTNRASGMLLSAGVVGMSTASLVGADVPMMMASLAQISPVLAKFSVSFPIVYHYVAGIRHVYWDKVIL